MKIQSRVDSLLDQLQLYTGKKTVKKKPPPFRQKFPIKTGVKTAEKERELKKNALKELENIKETAEKEL